MAKTALNTIAKNFGIKSTKDLAQLLSEYGFSQDVTSGLADEDYALFVAAYTYQNQIKNIQDYTSGKATIHSSEDPIQEQAAEEPAPVKEAPKPAPQAKKPVVEEPKKVEPRFTAPQKPQQNAEPRQSVQKDRTQQPAQRPQGQSRPQTPDRQQPQGQRQQPGDRPQGQRPQTGDRPQGQRPQGQGQSRPQGQTGTTKVDQAMIARRMAEFRQEQELRPKAPLYRPGEEPKTPAQAMQQAREESKKAQEQQPQQPQTPKKPVRQIKQQEPVDRFSRFEQKPQTQQPQAPKKQEPKKPKDRPDRIVHMGGTISSPSDMVETPSTPKVRIVDTHTTQIDLSKYDEHFDTSYESSQSDTQVSRQKLKKKNTSVQGKGAKDKERAQQERIKKMQAELARKKQLEITVPDTISVGELASRMKKTSAEVIKKLITLGVMASVSQEIDYDTAYLVCEEFNIKVTKEVVVTIEEKLFDVEEDAPEDLEERSPVVCVMGHVDHGKTSLLDAIRHTSVTKGEAGGITQHIGAYRVNLNGKDITFLDTPGHEAFTTMRARGAQATDIAILVVAGDDGIMPQTIEAINHAKAAGVDIIVAINKMDKPHANADQVMQELTKYDLVPEAWGGDVICCPVSALTGQGIDQLLESILLVAEVKELKANPKRRAKGLVIESRLEKGRGPIATILIQSGTLHTGDVVIAGTSVGRVRAMTNERNETLKSAGPSVPVEITGLSEVPNAGDEFNAVEDERMARDLAEQRKEQAKQEELKAASHVNLDDLFAQMSEGIKVLNIVVKADVIGSAEAVKQSLLKLSNEEIRVSVIHSTCGGITESDVMLAAASNAIIVGFNVRPDKAALDSAERQGVDIRTYRIIYDCIDEITAAMKGMLAPKFKENLLGHAEVRQTIHVPNVGTIAGCYVLDGKIVRHAKIRIVRNGVVIYEDEISSLKRFKDDAKEVAQSYECGVGLESFNDIKVGDILEAFIMEEVKPE